MFPGFAELNSADTPHTQEERVIPKTSGSAESFGPLLLRTIDLFQHLNFIDRLLLFQFYFKVTTDEQQGLYNFYFHNCFSAAANQDASLPNTLTFSIDVSQTFLLIYLRFVCVLNPRIPAIVTVMSARLQCTCDHTQII